MTTSFDVVSADDFAESDVTPRKASGRKAAPSPLVPAIERSLTSGKGMQTPRSMALKGENGSGSPYDATRRELDRAASQVGEDVRVTVRRVVDVEREGFAYLWFRAFKVDADGKEIGKPDAPTSGRGRRR